MEVSYSLSEVPLYTYAASGNRKKSSLLEHSTDWFSIREFTLLLVHSGHLAATTKLEVPQHQIFAHSYLTPGILKVKVF